MKIKVKEGGLVHRALTEPTLSEVDVYFAEQSRLTYALCEEPEHANRARLTPLGVLNGLFGVELQLKESASFDSSAENSAASSG